MKLKKDKVNEIEELKPAENEIVRPNFNKQDNKRKTLINVTDEQLNYDDFNSSLVEDNTVKELNQRDAKEASKVKTPEQIKKRKIILFSVIGAVMFIIVVLCIIKLVTADKGIKFNTVDISQYMLSEEQLDNTTENETDNVLEEVGNSSSLDKPYNIGDENSVKVTVNAKLDNNSEYEDFESMYYFSLSDIESDFDTVKSHVDAFNKSGNKVVNLDKTNSDGITPVMFNVKIRYPETYPTSFGDGVAHIVPDVKVELIGTYVDEVTNEKMEEHIVVNKKTFKIPEMTEIVNKVTSVNISDGYDYKCIALLPIGASSRDYIVKITVGDNVAYYTGENIQ